MTVWICLVEVENGGPDCYISNDLGGAFVNCFCVARDIDEALLQVRKRLASDQFRVKEISSCKRFEDDQFDSDDEENRNSISAASRAVETGEVEYGVFHSYPPEDLLES